MSKFACDAICATYDCELMAREHDYQDADNVDFEDLSFYCDRYTPIDLSEEGDIKELNFEDE